MVRRIPYVHIQASVLICFAFYWVGDYSRQNSVAVIAIRIVQIGDDCIGDDWIGDDMEGPPSDDIDLHKDVPCSYLVSGA